MQVMWSGWFTGVTEPHPKLGENKEGGIDKQYNLPVLDCARDTCVSNRISQCIPCSCIVRHSLLIYTTITTKQSLETSFQE